MSPYIKKEERRLLEYGALPTTPGQLNYLITRTILNYLTTRKGLPTYSDYNEVMGVLTCVQHELYRMRIAGYEDKKKKENGEVF